MHLSSWAFRTWPWLWSLESTARDQQHKIDICRYSLLEKLTNCTNKSPGPGMLCAGMLKNRDLLFIYLQKKVEWSGTRLFSVRTTSTLQSQQQKYPYIYNVLVFFREIDKSKKWIQPRPWSLAVRLLVWAHGWVCDGPLLVVTVHCPVTRRHERRTFVWCSTVNWTQPPHSHGRGPVTALGMCRYVDMLIADYDPWTWENWH